MKKSIFLSLAFCLASVMAMAEPVITASVDNLDFGEVEVGYPVKKTLTVSGQNLVGNIDLTIHARSVKYYTVSPEVITPDQAATGVNVTVTYNPGSQYWTDADLVLTSEDAADVTIPLTASPYFPEDAFVNNQMVSFSANVGQLVSSVGIVRFADYEVPTDPNPPVDRSGKDEATLNVFPGLDGIDDYSVMIEGSTCFRAIITKASALAKVCTVRITYWPDALPINGVHRATLKVTCTRAGVPVVTIPLEGTPTLMTCDPLALPVSAGQMTETSFAATWKMNCYEQGVRDFVLECAPAGSDFDNGNPEYRVFTDLTPEECPYDGYNVLVGVGRKFSYVIDGLQSDVIYSFRVKARFIDDTWSEWSNVQNVVLENGREPGDVDGDGQVTINDVTVLIDRLLGN